LNEKYNCNICSIIIKNEKPYLCYKCQKIFHDKCLKQWDEKCKAQKSNLTCPNCRNELALENWNKKLDYEESRNDNAKLLNKINKFKLSNNMNNFINVIKDKKIKELKNKENKQSELMKKYEEYIEKTIIIFKNILTQMNITHNSMKLNNNKKLTNLLNSFDLSIQNLNLDNISNVINEEFEQIKTYIDNNDNINSNGEVNINNKQMLEKINEYLDF